MNLTNLVVPLNQLLLDPNNYRLDYDAERKTVADSEVVTAQEDTLKNLEYEKLGELRNSILKNGFLEMDRVVVRRLEDSDFFLVVEGNRRTAAFKGLIEDHLLGEIKLPESLIKKASSINVVCVEGTEEELKEFTAGLMGVRHVSGPKRWSGYQSARLIDDRHAAGDSFEQIGALLGISDLEAQRRFRNYRAFLQMKQDEIYGPKILQKHYTLLSEFLSPSRYARTWLDWQEDEETDVYEFKNKENLYRIYDYITASDGKKAEVTNVVHARHVLDCIESDEHRRLIEQGYRLEDLPPIHKDEKTRLKLLKDFLFYVNSYEELEATDEEHLLMTEISKAIISLEL